MILGLPPGSVHNMIEVERRGGMRILSHASFQAKLRLRWLESVLQNLAGRAPDRASKKRIGDKKADVRFDESRNKRIGDKKTKVKRKDDVIR